MSKRRTVENDLTMWFYTHLMKWHNKLECPHDKLVFALKLSEFINSLSGKVLDPDFDHPSFQLQLFDYLGKEMKAKSRPVNFVYDITNHSFDMIDDKHFTSANVELCFEVSRKRRGKTTKTSKKNSNTKPTEPTTTTAPTSVTQLLGPLFTEQPGRTTTTSKKNRNTEVAEPTSTTGLSSDCNSNTKITEPTTTTGLASDSDPKTTEPTTTTAPSSVY